jgi:hypothetical protein
MTDPDNIFDVGLSAVIGALGVSAGWFLGGTMGFPMYCILAGIGIAAMAAGIGLRDLLQRRYKADDDRRAAEMQRQWALVRDNLVGVDDAVVLTTLWELADAGRHA